MCCGCGSPVGNSIGSFGYVLEKLASFTAMTAVIICIILTFTISLGLGVGLGYNYCFVEIKVMTEAPDTDSSNASLRSESNEAAPKDYDSRRTMPTTTRPWRTLPVPAFDNTMAIPLHGDFDFPTLLSKLRSRNRNMTLELIT